MKKLTIRESLRHLELLAKDVPGLAAVFPRPVEASAFLALIERLHALLEESSTPELSVQALRSTLFPHAAEDSQRVLFSSFRRTLAEAATAAGRVFSLHQPNLRGKSLDEVLCHFEGDSSANRIRRHEALSPD